MTLQEKIIQELNVKPSIDPKQEIEKRVGFLKSYMKKQARKALFWESAEDRILRLQADWPNLQWRN